MTNKEIVEMLKLLKEQAVKSCNDTAIIDVKKGSFDFVIDSAIKALSQEQQSEWERDHEILKAYADGQESMKPCKDAISRQAAIDAIWDGVNMDIYTREVNECLEKLPSVSTEKTGRWEWNQYDYNPNLGNWHCSECRSVVVECVDKNEKSGIPFYKYCPQCGAKMGVEE